MDDWSPMFRKNLSTMRDPRRTVVIGRKRSVRGRTWYHVSEACEFDGQLYLHRDRVFGSNPEVNGSVPTTRAEAVAMARRHAQETGNPYMPGLYTGHYGTPLTKA